MSVEVYNGQVHRVDGISKVTLMELRTMLGNVSDGLTGGASVADAQAEKFGTWSRTVTEKAENRRYWAGQARRWRAIAKALRVELPRGA